MGPGRGVAESGLLSACYGPAMANHVQESWERRTIYPGVAVYGSTEASVRNLNSDNVLGTQQPQ